MTEKEEITIKTAKDEKIGDIKNSKDKKNKKDKVKLLCKVIIRRLPPTMTEETFLKQIEPIPEHDYIYFVPADWSLGQNAACRAYIIFSNQEDIFIFKDKFDGYVFVDNKGAEYPAVVEFAPFQELAKQKSRKKDYKTNTIETDQHFISYMELLNNDDNENNKPELKMEYSYKLKDDKKITSTPLLQFLAKKQQEKRDEKKRKFDDKKKQRDDERHRKRNQTSKNIPESISEEKNKDSDDIFVRTVKSRPMDRNRNRRDRNENKHSADNEKVESHKKFLKEVEKKFEKELRKEARYARKAENKNEDKEKVEDNVENRNENTFNHNINISKGDIDEPVKREVKKYSESRRERRARERAFQHKQNKEENRDSNAEDPDEKSINKNVNEIKFVKKDKTKDENSTTKEKLTPEEKFKKRESAEKRREEKTARRIRNKDRPSIEIYRPGKSRLSTIMPAKSDSKLNEDESYTQHDKTSTTVDSDKIFCDYGIKDIDGQIDEAVIVKDGLLGDTHQIKSLAQSISDDLCLIDEKKSEEMNNVIDQ